jgi:hypothetical protein
MIPKPSLLLERAEPAALRFLSSLTRERILPAPSSRPLLLTLLSVETLVTGLAIPPVKPGSL